MAFVDGREAGWLLGGLTIAWKGCLIELGYNGCATEV